jgi:hypothetical protein
MAGLKRGWRYARNETTISESTGPGTKKNHLLKQVKLAREEGRNKAATKILAIIQQEHDKSFWRKINYIRRKVKGASPTIVQVPQNGKDDQVDEFSTQATVHKAIWANIHYKRMYLAKEAPICQGRLRTDFGYNAATRVATDLLEGRYTYPEDFDQATQELCKECALIHKIIPKNSVKIKMTKGDYKAHWKRAKLETSSSCSGLHFGHYIA